MLQRSLAALLVAAAPTLCPWTWMASGGLQDQDQDQAPSRDPDRDADGLSDFQEVHKYRTDPDSADSDGDGTPDGDWDERREWSYTIRTIVQVLPPVTDDVLCDDYQDARLLDRTPDYVELEVIHYPLNTVAQGIEADEQWREHLDGLAAWVEPGITSNWDAELARELELALAEDGIDTRLLDDRTLVQRASDWLCRHAQYHDGFSTFLTSFDDQGRPFVEPELAARVERGEREGEITLEQKWQCELYAKGMFEAGQRGSCTSSAIYLSGCLRALGLPTRTVLTIPLVDASDEREVASLDRLRHPSIRAQIKQGILPLANSWSSHTFNEVWVGGRWRRLNYDRLGQNTLDAGLYGLLTHVATFHDWSDANMPATWGRRSVARAADGRRDDVFGGTNPYHSVALSDRFGVHSGLSPEALPEPPEPLRALQVSEAFWSDHPRSEFDFEVREPCVLLYVGEHDEFAAVKRFTASVDRRFFLEAQGHPTLAVSSSVGGWSMGRDCYAVLHLGPADWNELVPGVAYTIRPQNASSEFRWELPEPLAVTR